MGGEFLETVLTDKEIAELMRDIPRLLQNISCDAGKEEQK